MASLLQDEEEIFKVPEDIVESNTEHKYNVVITTITGREYEINILYNMLQRSWRPSGNMEIHSFGKEIYLIHFELGCDYNTVITKSPWVLNEDLLLLEICNPEKLPHEYEFKYADFSIQIYGLSMSNQKIKMVEFIASKIGVPYPINPSEQAKWGGFARVRVKIDITQPIRQELTFTLPSKKKCTVSLRYERLPRVCFFCCRFGHIMKQCPELSKECEKLGFFSPETFMEKMQDIKLSRITEEVNANFKPKILQSRQPARTNPEVPKTSNDPDKEKVTTPTSQPTIQQNKKHTFPSSTKNSSTVPDPPRN
ncbi:uncharacterized protein LOC113279799 [Papaver somniferum]|uniref:uncharacterized protein LOC113279799 n=1 Tax=Papaver somniferum TaxID=3469 RepID=UPI000E70267A|nr:uncharacterized protein LOC113279799 [Papaver somniferum]